VNEVQAMAKIGETVGTVLGTAVLTARKASVGLSRAARRSQRRHRAQRAVTKRAHRAQEAVAETLTWGAHRAQESLAHGAQLAQKSLAEGAHQARESLASNVIKARHELAAAIEPEQVRRRRRWPLLLMILATIAGAAAFAISRRTHRQLGTMPHAIDPATVATPGSSGDGEISRGTELPVEPILETDIEESAGDQPVATTGEAPGAAKAKPAQSRPRQSSAAKRKDGASGNGKADS
jgi:hypothetical protein